MNRTLAILSLMTCALAGAFAQETTLQVAPSDQVVYPDAAQILNKTPPKSEPAPEVKGEAKAPTSGPLPPANAPLASTKPLASTPPLAARLPGPAPEAKGWYLRWSFSGDEAAVQAWVASLGREVRLVSTAAGWEAWQGPLTAGQLGQALAGQTGKASLVKK